MNENKVNINSVSEFIDRSNYLRGLLLLIRKDKNVWDYEHVFFLEESASLGFDKEFSVTALRELIGNKYIDNTPPLFSNKNYAVRLIIRGVSLIRQNIRIHPDEVNFLIATARVNGLSDKWVNKIVPQAVKA